MTGPLEGAYIVVLRRHIVMPIVMQYRAELRATGSAFSACCQDRPS
jgi:hypothetical protein